MSGSTGPVLPTKHHDVLWVSMMMVGYGVLITSSTIIQFLPQGSLAPLVATTLGFFGGVCALVGGLAVGYRTFKLTNRRSVADLAAVATPVRIEYVDGLLSFGGHRHAFLWWEKPPRLVLDSALKDQPTLRDFTIWHYRVLLRIMRRPNTGRRWGLMVLFALGVQFGFVFCWWILASRRP